MLTESASTSIRCLLSFDTRAVLSTQKINVGNKVYIRKKLHYKVDKLITKCKCIIINMYLFYNDIYLFQI